MRLYRKWWLRVCILFLSVHIFTLNAKGATHWRFENGRLNEIVGEQDIILEKDPLFRMLIDARSPTTKPDKPTLSFSDSYLNEKITASSTFTLSSPAYEVFKLSSLTCGDPVNETSIDNVNGIIDRFIHPTYPEPEVLLLFRGNEFETGQIEVIEANLINAVKVGENRVVLFNQVGNFLRIKGDTYHSIECFRSAMHASSYNPDVLLNLARVMINLNYLADAIYFAQRSLHIQEPTVNTWLQHFTLAEIFEKNGELEKSWNHYNMALDQNPTFTPVHMKLKKLESYSTTVNFNIYTLALVLILCITILLYFTLIYTL